MTMPLPAPQQGGNALRLRLFGFPVSIHVSFLIVVAILGYGVDTTFGELLGWLGVATVSILLHELGHAVAARRLAGASPTISLYGMGGLTTWRPARPPSRATSVTVAVAGPLTGVAFGLLVLVLRQSLNDDQLNAYVFDAALWVNLGWGLLNLLPILPLDGGHVLAAVLPGDDLTRMRRAAGVSVAVGVGAGLAALAYGLVFGAVLAGYFAWTSWSMWRGLSRRGERVDAAGLRRAFGALVSGDFAAAQSLAAAVAGPPELQHLARQSSAAAVLLAGQPQQAMGQLLEIGAGAPIDPILSGVALLATGQVQLGTDQIRLAHRSVESPFFVVLVWWLAQRGSDLTARLPEFCPDGIRPDEAVVAMDVAYHAGDLAAAVHFGRLALAAGFDPGGVVSYDLACALSRTGDVPGALRALADAAVHGFPVVEQADTDDDLAPVRAAPEWAALRASFSETATARSAFGSTAEPR